MFWDEFNVQDDINFGAVWLTINRYGEGADQMCWKPEAVAVDGNGMLAITASAGTATCGGMHPYTSGMVQWRLFNFLYGHLEVRAKMPAASGILPAIWLLGSAEQTNNTIDANPPGGNWPNPGSDEIDFVEFLNHDLTHVNQQIHTRLTNAGCRPQVSNASENFHVYTLDWYPGSLVWGVDGVTTCTLKGAQVSNTAKFLILDAAVNPQLGGPINAASFPATMLVDYVRLTP